MGNKKTKNNQSFNLCSLEKYEIEEIKKEYLVNKRKERQQLCFHIQNMY